LGENVTTRDLQNLFDYGYWANKKLFEIIAKLPPEQFTRPVAGSYGSIRNTLVHALSAEWGWLERCGGQTRGPALVADDYPTLESLVERWTQVAVWQRQFLSGQKYRKLDSVIEFTLGDGPKQAQSMGDLLQHAVLHGVHHRGQVALLLRLLGVAPGNFDYLMFPAAKAR
jgi:uncharacterized damage-inducible protein DinB